ncbi:MAG: class F sortase [Thermomicrobiales bacterium]|nr:class F sortase [Thermomicrobiales bacterium]
MQSLDLVLRRPTNLKSNLSKLVIAGATAAALILTPTLSTLAAPGGTAPSSLSATFQESPKIVPASGPGSDEETDDDISEDADDDVADDDLDLDENDGDDEPADERDDESADESSTLAIEGIISTRVDLNWNQWSGAMDSRLVAPFITLPRPVELSSDAIDLDATVTVREIVNGEMQTPKDEFEVSWYKETGVPGEKKTNMVFAGHLNWYNTPEAIFHNIDELEEGDEIVVTAEDGNEYTYVVKWVELVETANADMEEIVGPTKKTSLTLITCGGEWDPTVSQYKQRTVVRAELKR